MPNRIYSDMGWNFMSAVVREICSSKIWMVLYIFNWLYFCFLKCNNESRNKCNNKTPLKMIGEHCIYSLFINRNKKTIH